MRAVLSLVRAGWLTASSYRLNMVFSLVGLLLAVVPVYFVANALQPVMADAIQTEGRQYFGFLILGTVTFTFMALAVQTLPATIASGINTGVIESVWSTPASMVSTLTGLTGYSFLWTLARGILTLLGAWVLGAQIAWSRGPTALLIILLIVAAYASVGLLAAAAFLIFRTTGPFPAAILAVSTLLGGVYFPTRIIPSWLERVSDFVPLTYGLRALRRVLLEGESLSAVRQDLGVLVAIDVGLLLLGAWLFNRAFRHARKAGTLGQY